MISRAEVIDIIRTEVGKQVTAILTGQSKDADDKGREGIDKLYSAMTTIPARPVMHPYGLKSRAKDGVTSIVAVQGAHAGNRIIIGHRDPDAPKLENKGDVVLYDGHGNVLMLRDTDPYIDTGDRKFSVGGKDLPDSLLGAIAALVKQELEKLKATIDGNATIFNAMVLPSAMGPVGPPPVSMQNAQSVSDVKAGHVRLG